MPVRPLYQRHMDKTRRSQAELFVEEELPRRGRDKIVAAHNLRYALGGIVHHDRKLIGGRPRGFPHDKVAANFTKTERLRSEKAVIPGDGFTTGADAPGEWLVAKRSGVSDCAIGARPGI